MYLVLREIIPRERLVVIHAHLPEVEWDGVIEHIENTIDHEFFVVQAKKTFFQMVEHRKMFPSPSTRQCTSDLKRGPIQKKIINLSNTRGFNKVLNCMGLRAEESPARSKKESFSKVQSLSNSKRDWYEWLPVHSLLKGHVFGLIEEHGQQPHWAYAAGMTRLSCVVCIMSSHEDIKTAKRLAPEIYNRFAEMERKINFTMTMPVKKQRVFLDEITSDEQEPVFVNQLIQKFESLKRIPDCDIFEEVS
jgi:3'-phosphoadenosine 5'-phosphosulfate sulfotransferase (PAPS reductase)/FAD synthetase